MKVLYKICLILLLSPSIVLASEIPAEVMQAFRTTEGYKHEWVDDFQPPQVFHERKAGNCVDFAMHWQDVLMELGVSEDRLEIRVEDNNDGTTHMTLVVDGLWQMSAEPAGQFIHRLLKPVKPVDKGQRYVMVTDKGARITKANKEVCERDARAASRLHNVRCEKASM